MDLTVNVNVNAPELSNAIGVLAASLLSMKTNAAAVSACCTKSVSEEQNTVVATNEEVKTVQENNTEPAEPVTEDPPFETNITLEQVRAKLTPLSQAGKQAQVKKLITDLGATKLTEIPAEKYAELLVKAEEL